MQREIPKRSEPFTDTRERVARLLCDGCACLPASEIGHDAPSIETVRGALATVTTDRLTKRERGTRDASQMWRVLRTPRNRDDIGRTFLHRLQWHGGNGSATLHSSVFAVWNVGRETFEILDTIAAVFIHLFARRGLDNSHSGRWHKALTGSATWNAAQNTRRKYEQGNA